MDALAELCDLIATRPAQFSDKLIWICDRCPPSESLTSDSPSVTRSQLNALLAVARFLYKCPKSEEQRPQDVVLEFIKAIPASFNRSFWPQSYGNESISAFYVTFMEYLVKATTVCEDFGAEVAGFTGDVVIAAVKSDRDRLGIAKIFVNALSKNFPPILPPDAEKLISILVDQVADAQQANLGSDTGPLSKSSSTTNVPPVGTHSGSMNGVVSIPGLSFDGAGFLNVAAFKQQIASFEEETIESLEKQEVAFKLLAFILEKAQIDSKIVEKARMIAKRQLQSAPAFLRVMFVH